MQDSLKITIVTSYYPPDITSVSYYYQDLAHDLANYGAKVTLVCGIPTREVTPETTQKYIDNPVEKINDNLTIIRTGSKKGEGKNFLYRVLYHLYRSYCVYKKARKVDTDVYFVSCNPPHMGFFSAMLSKRAKTIYDVQDIFPDSIISSGKVKNKALLWFFRKIERFIYKRNTHLRVISSDMLKTLQMRGVHLNKLSLIYNWVDENKITNIQRQDNSLFDSFNLSRDLFYVCYAGNIGLLQNLTTMLNAAEILINHSDICFVIIGDGAWKPEMLRIIQQKKLTNIHVYPMQPADLVPLVYNLGDVGVVTIAQGVSHGSMPSKTWNIMSAARPVLCEADLDSELVSIINNNKCGLCVAPNDYQGFADAVLALYNDKQQAHDIGSNGRNYVVNHIARSVTTRKIYDCILDVNRRNNEKL